MPAFKPLRILNVARRIETTPTKLLHASFSSARFRGVTPNGTAIRTFRELQHLSLREVAKRAGLDCGHLSRLERRRAGASEQTLRRIAAALAVPVAAVNREEAP